jgi:hypothetical protein
MFLTRQGKECTVDGENLILTKSAQEILLDPIRDFRYGGEFTPPGGCDLNEVDAAVLRMVPALGHPGLHQLVHNLNHSSAVNAQPESEMMLRHRAVLGKEVEHAKAGNADTDFRKFMAEE